MGMIHLDLKPTPEKLRQFSRITPVMTVLIAAILGWRFHVALPWLIAIAALGVATWMLGCISPRLVRPLYVALIVAGYPIGWAISHLVMILFYFGIITPIALIFRLAGRDVLGRRWDRGCKTYWIRHPQCDSVKRYFHQY